MNRSGMCWDLTNTFKTFFRNSEAATRWQFPRCGSPNESKMTSEISKIRYFAVKKIKFSNSLHESFRNILSCNVQDLGLYLLCSKQIFWIYTCCVFSVIPRSNKVYIQIYYSLCKNLHLTRHSTFGAQPGGANARVWRADVRGPLRGWPHTYSGPCPGAGCPLRGQKHVAS